MDHSEHSVLIVRGQRLEWTTLSWNIVGVCVLAWSALRAHSVALGGFGLDSVIEIGASTVVLWELRGEDERRSHRALRLIGVAFILLAIYLVIQGVVVLVDRYHAGHSPLGLLWTGLTALVMLALSRAKTTTGTALANPVLISEGRVTFVDAVLAASVFVGVALNAALGWWWCDPLAGFILVLYAVRETLAIFAAA